MKIIIAGDRDYTDYETLKQQADKKLIIVSPDVTIVSGACNTGALTYTRPDGTKVYGADGLGERYAAERGYPVIYFPADFKALGKKAGPMRNTKMAVFSDALLAFWDGESAGTCDMIKQATGKGLKISIYLYKVAAPPVVTMSVHESRLQAGEAYMFCGDCGAKLYSFDGNKDAAKGCPYGLKNGKCGDPANR